MAYSYVRYTGNGSTTNYTFSFPTISTDHLKVRVNGALVTNWSFLNSSTIQFAAAPANAAIIEIRRETPKDSPIVNFTDGSVLLERDLDLLATYNLYVSQETEDSLKATIVVDSEGKYDADDRQLGNLAEPTDPQDAVTLSYLMQNYPNTTGLITPVVTMRSYVYVATAGQTVFTGEDANSNTMAFLSPYVVVSLNGLELRPTVDYTLSGTGTITLVSGASVGDELQVQAFVNFNVANVPSDDVAFTPAGTGAVATTVQAKLRESVSVKDFGAVGDGVADDTAAIQAALDYVGSTGGGTVKLPRTSGRYRITSGLKLPSYVTLEGIAADRYPFNSSPTESCLLADFSNVNQWVIEPKTTKNGTAVAYNGIIEITDTFTYTYNCCVKNLHIEAVNTVPFGAVRMHGCPGSMVENVSAVGTSAGLLVNQCYGGSYVMHNLTKYYGTIVWEDVNACKFDVYNAEIEPSALTVPAGYLMPFMSAFNGLLVGTYKLNTNDHYNRTWGMIVGASVSTSANNRIDVVAERYSGGVFQHQAYGTVFNAFYVESKANVMSYACVATVSRFVINSLHAYMSGTGKVFDLGLTVYARITAIGLVDYPHFGYGPFNDASSLVTIDGMSAKDFGPATPQPNLVYTSGSKDWVSPTLTNGWSNSGGTNQTAAYRLNSRTGNVELAGLITGGTSGASAFTLPPGFRPAANNAFGTQGGGTVVVTAAGLVIVTPGSGASIWLNGVSFYAEQ